MAIGRVCDFNSKIARCYCITGLIVSIPLYFLVLILTWSFAKGIPLEVRIHVGHSDIDPSFPAAVAVSLPGGLFILAVCFVFIGDRKGCADRGFMCAAFSWGTAFFFSGISSFIGAGALFIAAANPPAPDVFNPQSYTAFAAIAGILAAIAGIAYCITVGGYSAKRLKGKSFVWLNEEFKPCPAIFVPDYEPLA